jgi:hypothetical protein
VPGSCSWNEKLEQRQQRMLEQNMIAELKIAKQAKLDCLRKKREARKARKEENERKILNTAQVISNSKKLKRMSKRQLAQLKLVGNK